MMEKKKIGGFTDINKLFNKYFDFDELYKITGIVTENLN